MIIGWIFFSFIVGLIGSGRQVGCLGGFFISLFLSPVIGLIIVILSKTDSEVQREAAARKLAVEQKTAIDKMAANMTPQISIADELQKLKTMLDEGQLTEEEYNTLRSKLLAP